MQTLEWKQSIPYAGKYDVIVAGAGVAGITAAVAARRLGKSVLILEKSMELGGLATLGQINYHVPMCNGRGKRIIKGMMDELIALSVKYGYDVTPPAWQDGEPKEETPVRYSVRYSACMFALALNEYLKNEKVDLSFDTIASEPVMENGHCKGLIVENKSGRSFYEAGIVVDTTGDADILYRAGMPTADGKNYHTYFAYTMDIEHCQKAVESGRIEHAIFNSAGGHANLFGRNHPADVPFYTGTTGEDVNRYLINNQLEMLENLKKDGKDKGSRQVISLPGMCQFRATRRLVGDYTLQQNDVYKHFDDSISVVNDFEHRDFLWEVPYRTLVRTGFDNLITAGRSAAGDDYAWDVLRVIPAAIVTGQAAGVAAAQSLDEKKPIYAIDVSKLQKTLEEQDVYIHYDESWIAPDARQDVMSIRKLQELGGPVYEGRSHDE
ncbi:MAG: FAD-dependent oxidoreductase [Clostridia bacterium]|nr:FAD-dependent oxidoreductase [Clostridia bacterium]